MSASRPPRNSIAAAPSTRCSGSRINCSASISSPSPIPPIQGSIPASPPLHQTMLRASAIRPTEPTRSAPAAVSTRPRSECSASRPRHGQTSIAGRSA
jgi:hypothetical protein